MDDVQYPYTEEAWKKKEEDEENSVEEEEEDKPGVKKNCCSDWISDCSRHWMGPKPPKLKEYQRMPMASCEEVFVVQAFTKGKRLRKKDIAKHTTEKPKYKFRFEKKSADKQDKDVGPVAEEAEDPFSASDLVTAHYLANYTHKEL